MKTLPTLKSQIMRCITKSTDAGTGVSAMDIAERIDAPIKRVKGSLANLMTNGAISSSGPSHKRIYRTHQKTSQSTARTVCSSNTGGSYLGTELKRNPGLTDDRFEAFDLPSRMDELLYFRDGRITRLNGVTPENAIAKSPRSAQQ